MNKEHVTESPSFQVFAGGVQGLRQTAAAAAAAAAAKSLQSYPILCDPIDGSPPGSPVPGILQARTLEWVRQTSSAKEWSSILRRMRGREK